VLVVIQCVKMRGNLLCEVWLAHAEAQQAFSLWQNGFGAQCKE
jgi:hypothetical protein